MTTELLLVNLGTPTAPTPAAVRAFLAEFLADPDVVDWPAWIWKPILKGIVLRRRPERIAPLYASVWTSEGSPLAVATERLAADLARHVGGDAHVTYAYRYGEPGLAPAIRTALGRADRVVVVPLYPQRTASSTGTVERLAAGVAAAAGAHDRVRVHLVAPDAPAYIAALAARCEEAFASLPAGEPPHLVVSFHSIPRRVDRKEGGVYTADCQRTAACLVEALGLEAARTRVTFQSKFGPEPWLGPQTEPTLAEMARAGVRRVVVAAPGFLTPGLETVEELGVRAREAWLGAGGGAFVLAAAPAGRAELLEALAAPLGGTKSAR